MTMDEAIALQPAWIGMWLNVLMIGGFGIPLVLLIWRESRIIGILGLITGVLSGLGVAYIYGTMGYVKILGLPHIVVWTPYAIYMIWHLRQKEMRKAPQILTCLVLATVLVSLVFDYYNAFEWMAGETAAVPGTAPQ